MASSGLDSPPVQACPTVVDLRAQFGVGQHIQSLSGERFEERQHVRPS